MIESSFQDGNTAPGGAGRQGSCEHPSLLGTRSCGTVARAFPKGWTDSISGGAESSPGHVRAGSSAGAGRPRTGTVRAAAWAAVSIPWILAQHNPACLCCIPRPRSGPTWDFWQVLPHRTYLQGHAGRCRRVRGRHAVRQHRSHLAL